ncbi:hypothetical protein CP061683_0776B, partial [Chlamydia psittaci 06-1683]
ESEGMRLLFL